MKSIYLDYAAATPIDPEVLEAMKPYFTENFFNPSANYLSARKVHQALEKARADVAVCLGAKPTEVIFTAGATEANNLAIQGIMSAHPKGEILVSAIEHESVLEPAKLFKHHLIPVRKDGVVKIDSLEKMVTDKTVMVSIGLINNEIGTIQPIAQIAKLLNKLSNLRQAKKTPIYLHSDAAQAPSYLDLHTARLGVGLMSINGGKIYGPKQSGALFVRSGVNLRPIILGGGQEFGMRSGTENVAGAVGLSTALGLAQKSRKDEANRLDNLRNLLVDETEKHLPEVIINTPLKTSTPHILSLSFPDADSERLMMELDEVGVQTATGSACSASNQQTSHVLAAIGMSNKQARSTLRFSFGRGTSRSDIHEVVRLLKRLTAVR